MDADAYGDAYSEWKGWGGEDFAELPLLLRRYYDSEVAKVRGLPDQARVLEIGFGNGTFLGYAKSRGWSVTGTELIAPLVQIGQARGFDVHETATLADFPEASFDLVAAFDVLEHIPPEAFLGLLAEIARVLKPGGRLLARLPNGDSPIGLFIQNADPTHVNAIGSVKIRLYAGRIGASIEYLGGQAEPIFGGSPFTALQRLIARPIKALIDLFMTAVYFPGMGIKWSSPNLVLVMRFR